MTATNWVGATMRKLGIFSAALLAAYPSISLAQVDPDWARREQERMQAQQERWDAQVARQRAELERKQTPTPGVPQTSQSTGTGGGWIGLFERINDRKLKKRIGKMMAAGDCEGAAKLAYENGWLETGAQLKQNCGRAAAMNQSQNRPARTPSRSAVLSGNATGGSSGSGSTRLCPNGRYVYGDGCHLAPDGTYHGTWPQIAPNGRYVGGQPRLAPNGQYVGGAGSLIMCPDRSIVVGRSCQLMPDRSYLGIP